jgi:hypothetical protein
MVGSGIRPWEVPLRKLTSAMDAVQRLIEQRDEYVVDEEDGVVGKLAPLKLIEIKSGSAAYKVSATSPADALAILSATGRQIADPRHVDWSSATLSAVNELSEVARSLGCHIEFRRPGAGKTPGDILAKIGPDTYGTIASAAFITGETSVYGKIERVGGKTDMRCGLTVPGQSRMIFCKVDSPELTRRLGQYMYQSVIVSGTATWARRGSFLKTMTIRSYEPPKCGSIRDALDAVHKAGGSAWDHIVDARAAIAEMRA